MSAREKLEVLRAVEASPLPVREALTRLDVSRTTYYRCRRTFRSQSLEGLKDSSTFKGRVWNQLPPRERETILEVAMVCPQWSPREIACHIADRCGFTVSESTVYRTLKRAGWVKPRETKTFPAGPEYRVKTRGVNEQWQPRHRLLIRDKILMAMAALCALRVVIGLVVPLGEACHLTWADIDFGNGTLRVSAKRNSTTTVPWEPKDHEFRHVPLSPSALNMLAEWQAQAPEGAPYIFVTFERYRRVMRALAEGRWNEGRGLVNNVLRSFKAIIRRAGVNPCTLHDLRRSCITNWARELPAHVVQRLAGHSSLETTVRYYLSVQQEDLERARRVGDALGLGADQTDPKLTHSGQNWGGSRGGDEGASR